MFGTGPGRAGWLGLGPMRLHRSGPAAIRLLRASCGQTSHTNLYQPANNDCYLFDNLSKLGFTQQLMMVTKKNGKTRTRNLMPVRFVPFKRNIP